MTTKPKTQTIWEVRYASDIAGRALFDTYSNELDALKASRDLERSFRLNGLRQVGATVAVGMVTHGRNG